MCWQCVIFLQVLISEAARKGRYFSVFNQIFNVANISYLDFNFEVDALVFLPPSIFRRFSSRTAVGVAFAVYKESTLFPLREAENGKKSNSTTKSVVASPVVASTVATSRKLVGLDPPVEIRLTLKDDKRLKVSR